MRRLYTTAALVTLAMCSVGCTDADTFVPFPEFGGPAGVITGTVTYSGPPPCTQGGNIVGAAIVLAFEENLLPPPDGLGTTAVSLNLVTGEALFRGVRSQLGFDPGGALVCPPSGAEPIVVSAEVEMGPLPGGVYELRGFYDYDGDFNPSFSISNLPTAGDVGGGAIENAAAALSGAAPAYRRIPIGDLEGDGSRTIPPTGVLVEGVSISLGLPLPLERPVFHLRDVRDAQFGNTDPEAIVIPADYQLATFDLMDPIATEASFVSLVLGASVPDAEVGAATALPFLFPTESPFLFHTRHDVNHDGVIDENDSIPEAPQIPSIRPLGLLSRTTEASTLEPQRPAVLWQGITLLDGPMGALLGAASAPPELAEPRPELILALRPAMLCIDPLDPSKPGVLVNTHPTDAMGTPLFTDPAPLEAALTAQFGRPIELRIGCLPEGAYNLNLVYDTGQAWTVPNEAGQCAAAEPLSSDGSRCGSRARLASQNVVVTIGPPQDASYCAENPTPTECVALE